MDTMRCLALCLALLSTVSAQIFHVVAPNTLRLDSDETIAIALEGKPVAKVNVLIQDHPGKIKNISETVLDVHSDQPNIFKVRLDPSAFPPNFLTNPNSEKFVLLTVKSENFHKEIQIPVTNKAGYVFVQTDKPIYTPKEMVGISVGFERLVSTFNDVISNEKCRLTYQHIAERVFMSRLDDKYWPMN
ncbi:hypothetical protein AVEN_206873-1 [Araneus ventricosus]|uniref:Complement C3/4/5 macroglobulin domain-containing protein n=1 Tax=Araneus ventricosus TaxID=182803 RepID=A0A4Y2HZH7_ARAVE|nr:hypothetical protein AVEN_206873-1 [Araneus ventricosus]